MNMKTTQKAKSIVLLSAALTGALTGCVGYVERPNHNAMYVQPPPLQMEPEVVVVNDYVYYPGYQVYYSRSRRQYTYPKGRKWESHPTPPHVSVGILAAAPSVRLDFHDSPANHHAAVIRQYPKHWTPPAPNPSHGRGPHDGRDEGNRGDRR